MKNSDRFLAAFNRIEQFMNRGNSSERYITFAQLVEVQTKSNITVKRNVDRLHKFAKLRNAIVHQSINGAYAIAEPHQSIVDEIEKIEKELTNPPKVLTHFKKEVETFKHNNSIVEVLKVIRERDYTQFPVYKEKKFIGLLTENGITKWLARNIEEDIISLEETNLIDILEFEEEVDNYIFIGKELTVYEVEEIFKDFPHTRERLDALLITHSGKKTESLLGIITTWDILQFYKT